MINKNQVLYELHANLTTEVDKITQLDVSYKKRRSMLTYLSIDSEIVWSI